MEFATGLAIGSASILALLMGVAAFNGRYYLSLSPHERSIAILAWSPANAQGSIVIESELRIEDAFARANLLAGLFAEQGSPFFASVHEIKFLTSWTGRVTMLCGGGVTVQASPETQTVRAEFPKAEAR